MFTLDQLDDLLAELLARYPTEDNYSIGRVIHDVIGAIYSTYPDKCRIGKEPCIATIRLLARKVLDVPAVTPVSEEDWLDRKTQKLPSAGTLTGGLGKPKNCHSAGP